MRARCSSRSRRPTRRSAASSAWAPTATTSRSAAAGPCSGSSRRGRTSACDWIVFTSDEERAAEARAGAAAFLDGAAESNVVVRDVPATALPVRRRGDQGVLRRARSLDRAGPDLHPLPARPAPGPPRALGADLQHVARPSRPRVRDPEVGRRPGPPERLRPARAGARRPEGRRRSGRRSRASVTSTGSRGRRSSP